MNKMTLRSTRSLRSHLHPLRTLAGLAAMAAAGLLLLPGCKPTATTGTGAGLDGTYTLVSINGNPVPAGVNHDGAKLQVRSGSMSFQADGTCRSHTVFVPPNGTEATRDVEATYVRAGDTVRMKWKGAGQTEGQVTANGFTMTNEGMTLAYRK